MRERVKGGFYAYAVSTKSHVQPIYFYNCFLFHVAHFLVLCFVVMCSYNILV